CRLRRLRYSSARPEQHSEFRAASRGGSHPLKNLFILVYVHHDRIEMGLFPGDAVCIMRILFRRQVGAEDTVENGEDRPVVIVKVNRIDRMVDFMSGRRKEDRLKPWKRGNHLRMHEKGIGFLQLEIQEQAFGAESQEAHGKVEGSNAGKWRKNRFTQASQ